MAYLLLAAAIGCELVATSLLKLSEGLTRLWPTVGTVIGYVAALVLLAQTLKTMPMSVAYAIWSGAGTALIAAIGMVALDEPVTPMRIGGIVLIVVGVVALRLGGTG